MGYQIIKKVLR